METDEKGRVKCPVTSRHLRGRIWFQATQAQHDYDVAVVMGTEVPNPFQAKEEFESLQSAHFEKAAETARHVFLVALKAKADG